MRGPRHRAHRGNPALPTGPTPLDGLLEDVRGLRLTLAADLAAAAGAAEMAADDVAGDIVEGDRAELARFLRVADGRLRALQGLPAAPVESPRWRRRVVVSLPAIPLVGALALSAAAAAGIVPIPGHSSHPAHGNVAANGHSAAAASYRQLVSVVESDPSASQVAAAAAALHQQLIALIKASPGNPAGARVVAQLLQAEQDLLNRTQPPGTQQLLAAAHRLVIALHDATPAARPSATPRPADVPSSSPSPKSTKSAATPSTKPSISSSPSPKPTHSGSTSPSPSPSSSDSKDPIPHIGN